MKSPLKWSWKWAFWTLFSLNLIVLARLTISELRLGADDASRPAQTLSQPETLTEAAPPISSPGPSASIAKPDPKVVDNCFESLRALPGQTDENALRTACEKVRVLNECQAASGEPIFHYDRPAKITTQNPLTRRILTLSLVHGDEGPSGSVARLWMERLEAIEPRNHWRVVPILNPDGLRAKTRTNGRGVDINRNFPTSDWEELALKYWKEKTGSSERRFPGATAGSEPETICAIRQIQNFEPDFIIAIHTPLGVLDFDGPTDIPFPDFSPLPWKSLGHFPGSLGRYMWKDHGVPVLTVELKGGRLAQESLEAFDRLQDITGTVAIQAQKVIDELGIERKHIEFEPQANGKEPGSENSSKN